MEFYDVIPAVILWIESEGDNILHGLILYSVQNPMYDDQALLVIRLNAAADGTGF